MIMNYLLLGPEAYTKEEYKKKLIYFHSKKRQISVEIDTFYADKINIDTLLNSISTNSFFSKVRFIIIKHITKFPLKYRNHLFSTLKRVSESHVIILETEETASSDFIKELSRYVRVVNFPFLKGTELEKWIRREVAKYNKNITPYAVEILKERAGYGLHFLKGEIDKLITFCAGKETVDENDVENLMTEVGPDNIFALLDAVFEKKTGDALRIAGYMLDLGITPHQLIATLCKQFRNLSNVYSLRKSYSIGRISALTGLKRGFVEKLNRVSGNTSLSELKKNRNILLEADFMMKTGKFLPRCVLEFALVKLCE